MNKYKRYKTSQLDSSLDKLDRLETSSLTREPLKKGKSRMVSRETLLVSSGFNIWFIASEASQLRCFSYFSSRIASEISSFSQGIEPTSSIYRRQPSCHTHNGPGRYTPLLYHSGGKYSPVPQKTLYSSRTSVAHPKSIRRA